MANRIVRLTESDLTRLVRRVIKESETEMNSNQLKTNITTMFSDFPALMKLLLKILLYVPGKILDIVRALLKLINPFNMVAGDEDVYGFTAEDHPQFDPAEREKVHHLLTTWDRSITIDQTTELCKEIYAHRKEIIQKLKSLLN
jgi:hypothetical protein